MKVSNLHTKASHNPGLGILPKTKKKKKKERIKKKKEKWELWTPG